ncbi:hypothetical protein [Nocardiopsis baichengensis]|uniref:hypothetical protein n=1 Tax=Nocardiopsis baichengensis TaxID=280240 RepID=UPI00034BE5FF|nr:hypothetical protein [Nocardiopsis baichengensis]
MTKSGGARIDELSEIDFRGKIGPQVNQYAKKSRKLARDLASELDSGASDARRAMKALKGHPLLLGLDVSLRARKVARKLKRAKELAQGISAESIKFSAEYRKQFIHEPALVRDGKSRKVDL